MKNWNDYPPTLSITQASELLNISGTTLQKYCKQGKLPALKLGGKWRIDKETLRQAFAAVIWPRTKTSHQLGEIELALSTLAAIHRGTEIEEAIRTAHVATLDAYNQALKDEK